MFINLLLVLNFLSPIHAESVEKTQAYTLEMICFCNVYNEDGIQINSNQKDNYNLNSFGVVYGKLDTTKSTEALLCKDNMLGDITQSCAGAYARVIGACRALAAPYSNFIGASNFSVDTSTCVQNVELLEQD